MNFARWNNYDECVAEMMLLHSHEDAVSIADSIASRVNTNTLFKSAVEIDTGMKIMKGAGDEIVVYGPCSWAKRDPVGDFVTQGFMVNFFDKWFNKVPEEYRNIMLDHENWQVGIPLKSWTNPNTGEKFYTHVHEAAPMLLAKVRPDDGLQTTKKFRKEINERKYKSYSISWFPIRSEQIMDREKPDKDDMYYSPYTTYHHEGDPIEVTFCQYGMVDAAKFDILKQRKAKIDTDRYDRLERLWGLVFGKPFAGYDDFDDCVRQNSGKEDPDAYCASIMHAVEGKNNAASNIKEAGANRSEAIVPLELRLRLRDAVNEALENAGKGKDRITD